MEAVASPVSWARRNSRVVSEALVALIVCGSIAAGIWAIVNGGENSARGTYAGMDYGQAEGVARNALIVTFGKDFASRMRFGVPNVVNTHLNDPVRGTGQVRVFNVIGPAGTKYCLSVWGGGGTQVKTIWVGGHYLLQKNCYTPPTRKGQK